MQVILMEKVINLGQLGDVVKVKNGYARNFLIPQGKAKRATEHNVADFAARRAELEAADKPSWPKRKHVAPSWKASPCRSRRRRAWTASCSVPSPMPIS